MDTPVKMGMFQMSFSDLIASTNDFDVSVNRDNRATCWFKEGQIELEGKRVDGCVVPVLTKNNIEKTHPWTSCDI